MSSHTISITESALRLIIAVLFAGLVGWNREQRGRDAGLRTHMLVGLGSALVMIVSAFGFEDILGHHDVVLDPSRIAAQVVSGIGFLGTGAILRHGSVKGLTTAAGLWSVAAIGLAVGAGLYVSAGIATGIVLVVLAILRRFESKDKKEKQTRVMRFDANLARINILDIQSILENKGIEVENIAVQRTPVKEIQVVAVTLGTLGVKNSLTRAIEELNAQDSITNISIGYEKQENEE